MGKILGSTGRLLRVDLSANRIAKQEIPEILIKRYLGGNTLGLYYLLKEQKAGIDPLGPEAHIAFMASFATGTPGPGLSRLSITAKSPVSGGYGETEAGGWWAPELKFAGYDGVIVTGKADKPVYLAIVDDKVEIRPAEHLWGMELLTAHDTIKEEMGDPKSRVALIGPGGENLNAYACVINEMKHTNGRSGMGAVMGSKNLKAIAVRGTAKRLPLHDEEGVKDLIKRLTREWKEIPNTFPLYGTMRGVRATQEVGVLPTYNFREGQFKDYENLAEKTYKDTILKGTGTCYRCPIACKREVEFDDGKYRADRAYGGSEFETTMAFGTCTGVGDLKPISVAHQMCQEYGVDTISSGVMIAWLMECVENGLVTADQLDGIDLRFGDADAMLELLEKYRKREGVGDVLAQGLRAAIEHFGPETARYAMHVKNTPLPAHDPRGKTGLALAYALPSAGPDHMEVQHDHILATPGGAEVYEAIGINEPLDAVDLSLRKVRNFFVNQSLYNGYNAIGICLFCTRPNGPFTINGIAEYLRRVSGWEGINLLSLVKIGEKHSTMSRIFNLREGVASKDDTLPDRMFGPLEGTGPVAGKKIDREEFKRAVKTYYALNHWDDEGVPTETCLYHHELEWLIGAYPGGPA